MKVLVAEKDPVLRDQVIMGLNAFADMEVHEASGLMALDRIRHGEYNVLVLGLGLGADDPGFDLLDRLRSDDLEIDIVVVATEGIISQLREEKARGRIFAFLVNPLDPVEFFRTLARLIHRREPAAGS